MNILALDVGTSSVKAAVLDTASARPLGPIARAAYPLDQPTPDTATIDPDRLWEAIIQAARQAVSPSAPAKGAATIGDVGAIEGIGVSCLSPALVLLDTDGKPILPIVTHLDRRPRPTARQVWEEVGQEFLASVGTKPLPGGMSAVCYRWLAHEQPDLSSRVRHYLHLNGWLALRLTGKTAFDRANASFSGLYDTMRTRDWSPRWCDFFGVRQEWLPPVRSGDETVGTLLPDAARLIGLSAGAPVKLGTADTTCAMLTARISVGDLLHVVGTTQVLAVLTDRPEPAVHRMTRQLGVGDTYIHVTHNPVGGIALDWIQKLCFREQSDDEFYKQTIPMAMERETTVVLDPPFLGGDRLEIEPRRAAFRELGLATDRLDLLAALLRAMRDRHYDAVDALGRGRDFRRVFLTGGGAEVVRRLIPEYARQDVIVLQEASLCGVARLFAR